MKDAKETTYVTSGTSHIDFNITVFDGMRAFTHEANQTTYIGTIIFAISCYITV